jgi:hypothetical protein
MLEKLIQDDISAAKTPVLLVGFAGNSLFIVYMVNNNGSEICVVTEYVYVWLQSMCSHIFASQGLRSARPGHLL